MPGSCLPVVPDHSNYSPYHKAHRSLHGGLHIIIQPSPSLCTRCRGSRYLCGLAYCPILVSASIQPLLERLDVGNGIDGYTPPCIFVGRRGYPRVSIGPMVPLHDHASGMSIGIYDSPEEWHSMSLDEVLKLRLALVRGKVSLHAHDLSSSMVSLMQELAMADRPVDAEMLFKHRPSGASLSEYLPPSGPSAEIERLRVGNVRVDSRIEHAYNDGDLGAGDAILQLYTRGVSVTGIVRALSAGCLGHRRRRRLVPTRWSITAVDDTVSRALVEQVKGMPSVDEYIVYARDVSMNRFVCIVMPGTWEFEWVEAWFPYTTWNMLGYGAGIEMVGDHEGYRGRKDYAIVGGCYYSARLAVAEHLLALRRQARVLMLREIYPGFNIPVGVWFVRENVRAMLRGRGARFSSMDGALSHAMGMLRIPLRRWRESCHMLRYMRGVQMRLSDYA
ncbi:MAG: Nre family DNA repair protein [Candidatus Nitrosocaldus sp.]|nr:Nre family DNA repair protein [Candidatus Nitrosocaldus sp.]MDW8000386.1 Nre family DNA repair protein [Candidatus Nitrosocaldus sp.]